VDNGIAHFYVLWGNFIIPNALVVHSELHQVYALEQAAAFGKNKLFFIISKV